MGTPWSSGGPLREIWGSVWSCLLVRYLFFYVFCCEKCGFVISMAFCSGIVAFACPGDQFGAGWAQKSLLLAAAGCWLAGWLAGWLLLAAALLAGCCWLAGYIYYLTFILVIYKIYYCRELEIGAPLIFFINSTVWDYGRGKSTAGILA